jgi:hypothetical protein
MSGTAAKKSSNRLRDKKRVKERAPENRPARQAEGGAAGDDTSPPPELRRRFGIPSWLGTTLLALFMVGGWFGARFLELNAWFDERARDLAPLGVPLIVKGEVVSLEMKSVPPADAPPEVYHTLDAMIAGTQLKGREGFVSHLSRDTPRRDPFWRGWWVTVFLRTDLAEGGGPPRSTMFALRYEETAAGFKLLDVKNLGIL